MREFLWVTRSTSILYLCPSYLQVGVHIADVTHFIKPGTNLDDEAFKRGTTVYLADKVTIPTVTKSIFDYVVGRIG